MTHLFNPTVRIKFSRLIPGSVGTCYDVVVMRLNKTKCGEEERENKDGMVDGSKHSTVQYSTVQYSTVQYSTVQYSTVQHSTVQYSTVQYSTVQCSTSHHSTPQHSTAQHSTAQHSTAQHSTAQHSTAQHNTGIYLAVLCSDHMCMWMGTP